MTELNNVLPFGLTAELLLIYAVGLVAFLSVVTVYFGLLERDPMAARAKQLANRREELRRGLTDGSRARRRRAESLTLMRRIVAALKLAQHHQARKVSDRLARAGWRSRDAMTVYLFFKATMPVAGAVAGALAMYVLKVGDLPAEARILIVAGAALIGFYAPETYVRNVAQKRAKALQKALPDGLDLLVICAEAGLSLDAALDRVARELARSFPELADELSLTSVELGFLPERRLALQNLARRADIPAMRGVVGTLIQTEKYGTPLSQSLRVLSNEFRDQRMLRAEEKAARLPATLTVPMIVFVLPPLFIVLVGSAALGVLDSFGGG